MLGIFGNIPAFDTYFKRGSGIYKLNRKSPKRISKFYSDHKTIIDNTKIHTLDFNTGSKTKRLYPKAKIIDMIGFIKGRP